MTWLHHNSARIYDYIKNPFRATLLLFDTYILAIVSKRGVSRTHTIPGTNIEEAKQWCMNWIEKNK